MLTLLFWLMMHGQAKVATPQHEWMGEQVETLPIVPPKHALECQPSNDGFTCTCNRKEGCPLNLKSGESWYMPFSPYTDCRLCTLNEVAKPPNIRENRLDPGCDVYPVNTCKPAEHVIEIRTEWEGVDSCYCTERVACDPKDLCHELRKIRTLWSDGVKIGVVKGLE